VQREVALVAKAILESDLANRHPASAQLHSRSFHASANQILMRRHPQRFPKQRFKM
jgi:hypothetical protein